MHNPELAGIIKLAEKSIEDFKNYENTESKSAIFGLASKLLFVGSTLSELAEFELQPNSPELKKLIAEIKYELRGLNEMPLGTLIIEPNETAQV